jgi:hypothetical protein
MIEDLRREKGGKVERGSCDGGGKGRRGARADGNSSIVTLDESGMEGNTVWF